MKLQFIVKVPTSLYKKYKFWRFVGELQFLEEDGTPKSFNTDKWKHFKDYDVLLFPIEKKEEKK